MITRETTVSELLEMAIEASKEVSTEDKPWTVRDLFVGYQWNRIPIGNRTKLGGQFYSHVEAVSDIEAVGKTAQNQQQYKKI